MKHQTTQNVAQVAAENITILLCNTMQAPQRTD
jgi:hypothetical protein